ncbi:MAG: hypothetical protein P1Q69_19720, partial [Candidatus Thorarchaeota archaeon]|nr:hypothetical protein [Candidatus Thorarchaeota archaeon]
MKEFGEYDEAEDINEYTIRRMTLKEREAILRGHRLVSDKEVDEILRTSSEECKFPHSSSSESSEEILNESSDPFETFRARILSSDERNKIVEEYHAEIKAKESPEESISNHGKRVEYEFTKDFPSICDVEITTSEQLLEFIKHYSPSTIQRNDFKLLF